MQIGEEALGSEALRELIFLHYVIPAPLGEALDIHHGHAAGQPDDIVFLATTTNLTDGQTRGARGIPWK